jgi:hypothetical protein
MAAMNGTSGNDSINPSGNSPGVTRGIPTSRPDTISSDTLYNTGGGVQLYLNLGPSQTAVWIQGVSAYSMTAADFVFG